MRFNIVKKTQYTGKSNNICIIVLIVTAVFIFIFFTPSLLSCSNESININSVREAINKGEPGIEEIVLCKNVDTDFAPVEPAEIFAAGTNSIYLSIKFSNFTKDNSIKVVWSYTTLQEELAIQEFSPDKTGSGYYSFNIKIANSFPAGNYNAQIYFDNKLVKSADFSVE